MAFLTTADSFRLLKEGDRDFTYVIVTSLPDTLASVRSRGLFIGKGEEGFQVT
jgi:hypothetical protein